MERATTPQTVLVTGSAGAIGRAAARVLAERGHHVRGFDRVTNTAIKDSRVGDLTDRAAIGEAVRGVDTVIHLAATPDPADFLTDLLPNNVVGLYQLFDACREQGVKRIIYASSAQAVSGIVRDRPVTTADGTAPRNLYAVTKVWGEVLAEAWAALHKISVISVRLSWFMRHKSDVECAASQCKPGDARGHPSYLSHRDAEDFFIRCVETPNIPYALLFATSKGSRFDLSEAKRLLGYEPRDKFPGGLTFDADGRSV